MKAKLVMGVLVILWVGMILAIGMESVVKFNTPTLAKAVGFDVGRTIFGAFNKLQMFLGVVLILGAWFVRIKMTDKLFIAIISIVLALQIFWLFPVLGHRVDLILSGIQPPPTPLHGLYGILEAVKLMALFTLGIRLVRQA